ncbi:MAG: hypothetical protein AAB433_03000 [Nitrospirota bacterium]
MIHPFHRMREAFTDWRHRHQYPALPPPTPNELHQWLSAYTELATPLPTKSMTPREWVNELLQVYQDPRPPFIPLTIVSSATWHRIRQFCSAHDIEAGNSPWHRFDTRQCINVWSIDLLHPKRWGELLFAFYATTLDVPSNHTVLRPTINTLRDPEDSLTLVPPPTNLVSHSAIVIRAQIFHSHRPHDPHSDEIAQIHHFFSNLYHHAVGHPLTLSLQDRSTWPTQERATTL